MTEFYLVTGRQMEIATGRAVLLTAIALGLLNFLPSDAEPETPSTHIAIPGPLFDIARTVCQNNGGYRDVVIERASDVFTFRCNDGMTLRDAVVKIK